MKKPLGVVLEAGALLVFATTGSALEKTTVRANRNAPIGWDASATCSVFYANVCTGWLHVWSGWLPREMFGVVLNPPSPNGQLVSTQVYFWTGDLPGWGFTGSVTVSSVVDGCPGTPYDSYDWLPPEFGGGDVHTWTGIPPGPVALSYRLPNYPYCCGFISVATDHPSAGPTGPAACGFCYPTTRPTHSFYWGTTDSPLCPGAEFADGVCDAELLYWGGAFTCPVSVGDSGMERRSWGMIKSLYR
jgi:hypothetical protein